MNRKSRIKTFLNQKHKLMLIHADTYEQRRSYVFTNRKFILAVLLLSILFFVLSYFIIAFTPIKQTLPGFADLEANNKQAELIRQLNEMKLIVSKQDSFITSIKRMSGYIAPDSVAVKKEEKVTYLPKDYLKKVEEQTAKQNLETPDLSSKKVDIMGKPIVLFPPVNGILTSKFDIEDHYAIDLAAKSNEPVKAIADGYVIFSEFSSDNGNVIAIAHSDNIISIYKHNSKIFKKTGSFVYAGEPIAIVGNTGENSNGPHLHFELWIHGKPVNPLDYFTYVEK